MKPHFGLLIPVFILLNGCGGGEQTPIAEVQDVNESNQTLPDANRSDPTAEPLYKYAWHLHKPDEDFATRFGISDGAGIGIEPFWLRNRGAGVTVAVLDDYFEPTHPDLHGRVLDVYNAHTGTTVVTPPAGATAHGQVCAGLIAAEANGIGIAGVAPEADLILIGSAFFSDADIIRAFEYAKSHGADVISCSWGSYSVSEAVADAIKSAYDANITVVFAAGNDNVNLDEGYYDDESELPWVIGVGSSSEYNVRSPYSNYGGALDCLAPGGVSIGLPGTDLSGYSGYSPAYDSLSYSYLGTDYAFLKGTSAAAPVTAGAAALIKSRYPGLTPDAVREMITAHAEKIGSDPYDAAGFNPYYGYGKVNLSEMPTLP